MLATAEAFRAIAELGGDLVFIIDCTSGLPVYISPHVNEMLGYGASDVHDQFATNRESPLAPLCTGLQERLRRFAAGDGSRLRVVREFELLRPDGREVPLEVISTLLLDQAGRAQALAGYVRDQSARRAREREQKRFASMLNHEFRTPLSTIDGAIQRLEATNAGADEATRQRHRKIANATDRLIAMLDDYLSPERMAALGRQRQPNTVAPRLLLEELVAQARVAGRPVQLQADELPALLRGEPAGLRLALKILLDNALRYTPAGSALTVLGQRAGNGVVLALRDAGPGVPPADLPRVFDKGYRGSNAAGLPGSGLGLYMARSVVEVHGGTLDHVAAPGGGAEFRLCLPVQDAPGKGLASSETSSDNRNGLHG
ncbi:MULTISPECIES: PAS domain-containing sensor histidine kinase [unclassified Massilia]|uniref:PAS domain-containing sensor histidine kinase n=1 Tax=unclassified Massilia TaxID=2609279 RepID=UPI000B2CE70B|nr:MULTISPECIES: PAS domain-containing sensor histidine kinase [unclassified Massilia]